jgi:hypothetical protein
MRTQLTKQIMIHAPADDVWAVLAREFAQIGHWATGVLESSAVRSAAKPDGAKMAGRECAIDGFGTTYEIFAHYDEQGMTMGYTVRGELPSPLSSAFNHWTVRAAGANQTLVEVRPEIELASWPGAIMAPVMRLTFGRTMGILLDDLKYYVEQRRPSPRKLDEMDRIAPSCQGTMQAA